MRRTTHYSSTGALTAIAAALALSSTQLAAQQTQPITTDPTPPVSAQPAPSVDVPPPATDTTVTPSAATESTPDIAASIPTAKHAARTAAKPAAAVTHTGSRTTTAHVAQAAPPAMATRTASVPAAAPATPPAKAPAIVDLSTKTAATNTAPAAVAPKPDNTPAMVGGGALALLAIGGGAYALSRRRRTDEEVVYGDEYEPETVTQMSEPEAMPRHDPIFEEQPAIVAPSAFAWGDRDRTTQTADDGSDRRPGETWAERAHRGPSPANPSASIRTRLKRAAFFDKREREVAAGTAEPVEADAGLPEAAVEEHETSREREVA